MHIVSVYVHACMHVEPCVCMRVGVRILDVFTDVYVYIYMHMISPQIHTCGDFMFVVPFLLFYIVMLFCVVRFIHYTPLYCITRCIVLRSIAVT